MHPLGPAGLLEPGRKLAELAAIAGDIGRSRLAASLRKARGEDGEGPELDALRVPCIAERALVYLFAEQNLLPVDLLRSIVDDLGLDREFLRKRLADNRRPVEL